MELIILHATYIARDKKKTIRDVHALTTLKPK